MTDVNDNSPVFIGSPYVLNISELSLLGSVIYSDVLAVDVDQPGPFSTVQYNIEPGPGSDQIVFDNQLQGRLTLAKKLDYEKQKQIKVKIVAQDQGLPPRYNQTSLTINVLDADDQNPAFYQEQYSAKVPEFTSEGLKLVVEPEDVRAYDKDTGINAPVYYTWAGSGPHYRHFQLNRNTGTIYLAGDLGPEELRQPRTLVIRATQFDNPDRYSVTTLRVSRSGQYSAQLSFLQRTYTADILENTPLNSPVLSLAVTGASHRPVQFSIDYNKLPGQEFSVNERGEITLRKTVDFENVESYSFIVTASDGWYNDTATVNISLININDWDPRFRYPQYEFYVSKKNMVRGHKVGEVEVFDGDKGDRISLDIRGAYARVFGITNSGELRINNLKRINGTEAHIVVVAEDSGVPPRRASVPVVVRFDQNSSPSSLRSKGGHNVVMIVVLSIVIIFSLIVIIGLAVYICKHKKRNKTDPARGLTATNRSYSENIHYNLHQLETPNMKHDINHNSDVKQANLNPLASRATASTFSGPVRPQSAASHHSTEPGSGPVYNPLNPRSGSRRYVKNGRSSRVHPPTVSMVTPDINQSGLPKVSLQKPAVRPKPPNLMRSSSTSDLNTAHANLQEELKRAILGSSQTNISRLEWPSHSMPRLVKKLSYQEEGGDINADRDISTYNYTDPNMSVTPAAPNLSVASRDTQHQHQHF